METLRDKLGRRARFQGVSFRIGGKEGERITSFSHEGLPYGCVMRAGSSFCPVCRLNVARHSAVPNGSEPSVHLPVSFLSYLVGWLATCRYLGL